MLLDDTTEVLAVDHGRMIRLRARGWPLGEAVVEVRVEPAGDRAEVTLLEDLVAGVAPESTERALQEMTEAGATTA